MPMYRAAWVKAGKGGGYTFFAADHQSADKFAYEVLEPILKSSAGRKELAEILTIKQTPSRFPTQQTILELA